MTQNINLASLTEAQGFSISGLPAASESGFSVRSAGNINGDEYQDIIIGAPSQTIGTGVSYIIYGGISLGNINLSELSTYQGFSIIGNGDAGNSVSGAGDVNGDGYDDVIIGAYSLDSRTGYAYVIYGGTSLENINLASENLTPTQGFSISGANTGDLTGNSVSGAGDVNGDGYDDVIIGAPYTNSYAGESYVIFGSNQPSNIALSNLPLNQGFSISGFSASQSGFSVSGIGDVNGDGYDDVIIGAPYAVNLTGETYVIYGKTSPTNINLANLTLTQGFSISGAAVGDYSGYSVSGVGNVNNDGYDDFIIGAPNANYDAGVSYVIYGGTLLNNINLASINISQGFLISGVQNSGSGIVGAAGDVNNDGYDDMTIGAPTFSISYIIYGGRNLNNINLASLTNAQGFSVTGYISSLSGYSVSGAGDVNGDGYADNIIGAPATNNSAGESYLIYGAASGFVTSSPTSFPTEQPTSQPTISPANSPSSYPSTYPSGQPSENPSIYPSSIPTTEPSSQPSSNPSIDPSSLPTSIPSIYPSVKPTTYPSSEPTSFPSSVPTVFPSTEPSSQPSAQPFTSPTSYPSSLPTSKPSRPYELVLNYNVQTAIFSTLASLSGGIILYLAPSFILKNWGYKYKYVYSEQEKENLLPHEIGLYKKEDQLFALHKEKNGIVEYLLQPNPRDINDISLTLYQLIWEQLENNPEFKRNPVNSKYKYIYNEAEVNYLKENEIGLKFTGSLPLLSCNIFCNSEKLIAFKLVDGVLRRFPLRIASEEKDGIPTALYHSIAAEYLTLSNSLFTTFEENQIRDFLLVSNRLRPGISVFQKIFCLYTPVYKDLGSAPGFVHNALNCNGYGPDLLYRLITLDGFIPGFIYGLCHSFLKKYQVSVNPRIYDDSFAKIATYLDSHIKSEVSSQTINNPINQEKKDDLERGQIGSDLDSSSFEQASSSGDMFDRIKKPTSTCIIQAVYEIEFDDPIINNAYNKRLGLAPLKSLAFSKEETDLKQITKIDNSESYKSYKPSSYGPDVNYPNHIIGKFINARQVIEYIPIMKYVSQNIVYPLIENHLPKSAKNISLPEIFDSQTFLFTAHLGLGSIGAMLLPHEIIYKGLISSTASSTAFGFRLAASDYLREQKQEVLSNYKPIDAFEISKYCVSTIFAYTVPAIATCALAQIVMPGYNCAELDLVTKLSFAGAECYSVYKTTQVPIVPTTVDVFIPYITDFIVANAAYANGYGAMSIVTSVFTVDWMSRLVMDMTPDQDKENYIDPIFDYALEAYFCVYETINQIIAINHEL